jgi:type I restriction enzyme M protein
MDHPQHNQIVNFIWGIADDVLRDVYVRGKYRDVILPMTVIRRLDVLLEPKQDAVLKMKATLDRAGVVNQEIALRKAAGQPFFNASSFTLRRLLDTPKQLKANFQAYLDGFSANVQEIVRRFRFREQLDKLAEQDILGHVIEKFIDPKINLSPKPVLDGAGNVRLPGLDNHGMGYVFEELIRRFNEENNEEAGEHFTPREVVRLMARLVFLPIADRIESGTYLVYDGACGTGGMLTVSEQVLKELAAAHGKQVSIHLHGQEINDETYAICKADLLLKGEGEEADNIKPNSTLSNDGFPSLEFDFMLSNPPYGKSWKTDLDRLCGGNKKEMKDPRFVVSHAGDNEFSLVTRSSDGQLMFLVNMLSKMKRDSPLGSRIAEVHNGSSLFTGDAGQGESNIRRWVIENDWLEAIVALPLNMFYNTGIATYVWVLSSKKPANRRGRVQLIDATGWFTKLRKNLGQKNCELSDADIGRICDAFLKFEETEHSKIFRNEEFGYRKVVVERPLRLSSQFSKKAVESLRFASGNEELRRELYDRFGARLYGGFAEVRAEIEACLSPQAGDGEQEADEGPPPARKVPDKVKKKLLDPATWARDRDLVRVAKGLADKIGEERFDDHNAFRTAVDAAAEELGLRLSGADRKAILAAASWRNPDAVPVVRKRIKPKKGQTLSEEAVLYGTFAVLDGGEKVWVEYEPDPELRDTENVPLTEPGGVSAFFEREVKPHVPDAWIDRDKTAIGYEIPFTRHFYRYEPLRPLSEIAADLRKLEQEAEGLLEAITGTAEENR